MEPAGAAEVIARVRLGDDTVVHYVCLNCGELFDVQDGEFVVHDCLPGNARA